jgi:hypothetical protein
MQLDQGCKTQKAQRLDFTTNENGFVKIINTIFFSRVANKQWGEEKENPQRLPLGAAGGVHRRPRMSCPRTQIVKQEIYQLGHFGNYLLFLVVSRYSVWELAERAVG